MESEHFYRLLILYCSQNELFDIQLITTKFNICSDSPDQEVNME